MGKEVSKDSRETSSKQDALEDKTGKRQALLKLQQESGFTQPQIEGIYEHFRRIATLREDDGVVSKDEFLDVLQAKPSVLLDRMFTLFDHDNSGHIDFREFLVGLAILCDRSTPANKLKFAFRMYDLDGDGYISKSELTKIVESCLFQNSLTLPREVLMSLVDATFASADVDGDGRITESEFERYVVHHPQVIDQLTVNAEAMEQLRKSS